MLKPDGVLIATFAGGETLHELRTSLMQAELIQRGGAALRVYPMMDVRDGGNLLVQAGFALPVADVTRLQVHYRAFDTLLTDLRAIGEKNRLSQRVPLMRRTLAAAKDYYETHFSLPDGTLMGTFDLITLTGWKPHASQPKPLARGSAHLSLTQALKEG